MKISDSFHLYWIQNTAMYKALEQLLTSPYFWAGAVAGYLMMEVV